MKARKSLALSRLLFAVALVSLAVLALTACNTVKGVGQDITGIGQAGQDFLDNGTN